MFDIEGEGNIGAIDSSGVEEVLGAELDDTYSEELVNPIRHYIKEIGGMSLLTREGEKEIARKMEESKEKIKQINQAYGILKSEFKEKYFILRIKSVVRPVPPKKERPFEAESNRGGETPVQKDQVKEFFFVGALPKRALRLGEYLFCLRIISWGTLVNAIAWQYRRRPRIGEIALDLNYLTHRDLREILKKKNTNEPFGHAAVRLGFLSDYRRFVLLGRQRRFGVPLGKFFIDLGIVTEAELDRYVQENRLHNSRYDKSEHRR